MLSLVLSSRSLLVCISILVVPSFSAESSGDENESSGERPARTLVRDDSNDSSGEGPARTLVRDDSNDSSGERPARTSVRDDSNESSGERPARTLVRDDSDVGVVDRGSGSDVGAGRRLPLSSVGGSDAGRGPSLYPSAVRTSTPVVRADLPESPVELVVFPDPIRLSRRSLISDHNRLSAPGVRRHFRRSVPRVVGIPVGSSSSSSEGWSTALSAVDHVEENVQDDPPRMVVDRPVEENDDPPRMVADRPVEENASRMVVDRPVEENDDPPRMVVDRPDHPRRIILNVEENDVSLPGTVSDFSPTEGASAPAIRRFSPMEGSSFAPTSLPPPTNGQPLPHFLPLHPAEFLGTASPTSSSLPSESYDGTGREGEERRDLEAQWERSAEKTFSNSWKPGSRRGITTVAWGGPPVLRDDDSLSYASLSEPRGARRNRWHDGAGFVCECFARLLCMGCIICCIMLLCMFG